MERLEAAQALLEEAAEAQDLEGVLRHNIAFHAVIEKAAGNDDAAELAERYRPVLTALIRLYGFPARRNAGVVSDHRHIIVALKERDGEAVSTLITAHAIKGRHDLVAAMSAGR
jgi:DNA-binding GntR family transcriptional regulator